MAARAGNVDVDNRVGLRCKLEHTLIVKSAVSRAGARTRATSSVCNYHSGVRLAGARPAGEVTPGWEPRPGPGWSRSHRRDLAWPNLIEPSNILPSLLDTSCIYKRFLIKYP